MMSDIQSQCRPPEFDQSIFNQFEAFIASKEAAPSGLDGDSWYKDFITKELKNNKQSVAAYNQLCPSESMTYNGSEDEKPHSKFTCTATCSIPGKCTFEVMEEGKPETKKTVSDSATPFDPQQEMIEIKPDVAPEGIVCPITWTSGAGGDNNITVGGTDGGPVGGSSTDVTPDTGTTETTDKKPEESVETTEKEDNKPTEGKPVVSITVKAKEKTHYTLVADTQKDEGWTFSWIIKDAGELKVETDWEAKKKPEIGSKEGLSSDDSTDDSSTDESKKTDTDKEKEKEEKPSTPEVSKEIKQKRYKTPYKVCAQLKKEGEETVEDCETVEKLGEDTSAVKPATTPSNFMPQQSTGQPQMIRRSSDTSAVGIK